MSIWHYFQDDRSEILGWLWTTVWLAVLPLVLGLAVAVPIGWFASAKRWAYPPVVTLGGALYTIPSVVLFVVLPGILHTRILDPLNVAVALTLYCVALLVRVVADGLSSVSAETLAAATAMGFTGWRRFRSVQLPVAVPVIGAGVRVAAVSNVSLVAVASTIGVSQLGQLFVAGDNAAVDGQTPILLGLVLFVLLALVVDAVVLLAIRLLAPWRRAVAR